MFVKSGLLNLGFGRKISLPYSLRKVQMQEAQYVYHNTQFYKITTSTRTPGQ